MEKNSLGRYTTGSPFPVMQEFARVAGRRGYTSSSALADLVGIDRSSLKRQFEGTQRREERGPNAGTVDLYRTKLQMHSRHVRAIQDELRDADLNWARRSVAEEVASITAQGGFVSLTTDDRTAIDASLERPNDVLAEAFRSYIIAHHRQEIGITDELALVAAVRMELRRWWKAHSALFAFCSVAKDASGASLLTRFRAGLPINAFAGATHVAGVVAALWDLFHDREIVTAHLKAVLSDLLTSQRELAEAAATVIDLDSTLSPVLTTSATSLLRDLEPYNAAHDAALRSLGARRTVGRESARRLAENPPSWALPGHVQQTIKVSAGRRPGKKAR